MLEKYVHAWLFPNENVTVGQDQILNSYMVSTADLFVSSTIQVVKRKRTDNETE